MIFDKSQFKTKYVVVSLNTGRTWFVDSLKEFMVGRKPEWYSTFKNCKL